VDEAVHVDGDELREGLEHQPGDLVLEQEDVLLDAGPVDRAIRFRSTGAASSPSTMYCSRKQPSRSMLNAK